MKKQQIESEVQRTLASLDQLQRLEGNPFLATRVLAQWEREQETAMQTSRNWKWQWALVAILLIINSFAVLPKWLNFNAREDHLNSIAAEYSFDVNTETDYDYTQTN